MSYVVFARKYRPAKFEDVVGQQHVSDTLKKALQTDHLAHAFLFCGPRGVGKTTCARILARVLNCSKVGPDYEPCGECESCKSFNENASFNIFELDGASNNQVDHMRALVEQVRFQPQSGKYKVYIIDEVHMLSASAFNAFLKTLEEPPPHVVFILATTEKHKILPTILSRCQTYDFKRIQVKDIVEHLQQICDIEKIKADKDALHIIGQKADGSLRDALSLFDRIVALKGDIITYEDSIINLNVLDYEYYFRFADALLVQDLSKIMLIFDEVLHHGFEGDWFIAGLAEHLRNLLVSKDSQTMHLLEVSETLKERFRNQAAITPPSVILSAIHLANECDINYKTARNKRVHVEMALIKMCFIQQAVDLASLQSDTEKKKPELISTQFSKDEANLEKSSKSSDNPTEPTIAAELPTPSIKPDDEVSPEEEKTKVAITDEQLKEPDSPYTIDAEPQSQGNGNGNGSGLRKSKSSGIPTLQSLDDIHEEVIIEENGKGLKEEIKFDESTLVNVWMAYAESIDRDSAKMVLKNVTLTLKGKKIFATVSSALAENTIRQETELMPWLRSKLGVVRLSMEIKIDQSKVPVQEPAQRPMTESEKYWQMKSVNPLVDELRKRLDLQLDRE